MITRRAFEGAVFVTLTAGQERSCQCACIAVGHQTTCLGRIPAGAEFQLALIERPVAVLRQFGFPRPVTATRFRFAWPARHLLERCVMTNRLN
jgi:hypothetical protein